MSKSYRHILLFRVHFVFFWGVGRSIKDTITSIFTALFNLSLRYVQVLTRIHSRICLAARILLMMDDLSALTDITSHVIACLFCSASARSSKYARPTVRTLNYGFFYFSRIRIRGSALLRVTGVG